MVTPRAHASMPGILAAAAFLAGPASWPECSVRSPLVDIQRLSAWGSVRVERPAVLPIAGARSARRLRRAIIGGEGVSSAILTRDAPPLKHCVIASIPL